MTSQEVADRIRGKLGPGDLATVLELLRKAEVRHTRTYILAGFILGVVAGALAISL